MCVRFLEIRKYSLTIAGDMITKSFVLKERVQIGCSKNVWLCEKKHGRIDLTIAVSENILPQKIMYPSKTSYTIKDVAIPDNRGT